MQHTTTRRITATVAVALLVLSAIAPTALADHAYEQEVWFEWDTAELDVLVVGVEDDPLAGQAIRDAIDSWEEGIDQLAPTWLADGLVIRAYIPGLDPAPPAGYEPDDVEIHMLPVGFMAFQEPYTDATLGDTCYAFAPLGYPAPEPLHPMELYFTAAHEFGHCLGLTHVFNHGEEYEPAFDLLGGGSVHDTWGKSCPSNLNVQVLERVYGGLFDRPSGGSVTLSSSSYVQASC